MSLRGLYKINPGYVMGVNNNKEFQKIQDEIEINAFLDTKLDSVCREWVKIRRLNSGNSFTDDEKKRFVIRTKYIRSIAHRRGLITKLPWE